MYRGASENDRDAEQGHERTLRERGQGVVAPGLEGVEEGVAPPERIQHAHVRADAPVVAAPSGGEPGVQLEVNPEKVVVESFQERRIEGGRARGFRRVGVGPRRGGWRRGDLHVVTEETKGAERNGGVRKARAVGDPELPAHGVPRVPPTPPQ